MERLTVLYDASCGFCASCRKWLEAQPAYLPFKFIPAGSPAAERRFPDLSPTAADELTVVGDDGSVYRGMGAWIVCLWALEDYRSMAERLSAPSLYPLARQALQFVSQMPPEASRGLAHRPDQEVAQELSRVAPRECGRTSSPFPVVPEKPHTTRRIGLFFLLFFIAFLLLADHSQSILLWAVERGILTRGATLRLLKLDLEQALENAARREDVERVRLLLELGADPNRGAGRNALVDAAIQDRKTLVQILRLAGAQADTRDADGRTPLMLQAAASDVRAVKGLLAAGADPNARDNSGDPPLVFVIGSRFVFQSDSQGNIILSTWEVFRLLLSAGADPNARGKGGRTALVAAIPQSLGSDGTSFFACHLLAAGADPNVRDENGRTALMEARYSKMAKALIDAGADPNLADKEGETPLHKAAQKRDWSLLGILLGSGGNAGAEAADGSTPFLTALRWSRSEPDDVEMVRRLFAAIPPARRERDLKEAVSIARYQEDRSKQALLTDLSRSGQRSASQ